MKELIITPPNGYEIDREKSTIDKIIFKKIETPSSWEEFLDIKPMVKYAVDIKMQPRLLPNDKSRILTKSDTPVYFSTIEECNAWMALFKLIHLRNYYNKGWGPNWSDHNPKYVIVYSGGLILTAKMYASSHILAFESKETRDLFLHNFKDLIEQAKMFI